jgi:hypothetical protein
MAATTTIGPAPSQCMRALEGANRVRTARAKLKRSVAFGEVDVGEVILDCPWEARSMLVSDLLMSQSQWGVTRSRRVLALLCVSEHKTVGSMTERQRRLLATLLAPAG